MSSIRKIYIIPSLLIGLISPFASAQDFPSSSQIQAIRENNFPNSIQDFRRSQKREELERQLDKSSLFEKFDELDRDMQQLKNPAEIHKEGIQFYREKKYEKAVERFSWLIEQRINLSESYLQHPLTLAKLGQHQAAIVDYNQVLGVAPENPDLYVERGLSYQALEQYKAAEQDFTKAIELESESYPALNNRGGVYSSTQEYGKAIADYSAAIQPDPK